MHGMLAVDNHGSPRLAALANYVRPTTAGRQHYLTSITKVDDELVEVIDVEKVLAEIVPYDTNISAERLADPILERARGREVLCVDDSSVALAQLRFGTLLISNLPEIVRN